MLRGIVNKCEEKGINRVLGTLIAYVVMVVVIAVVLLFMFSPAFGFIDQVKNIIEDIPKYIAAVADWGMSLYSQYGHFLKDANIQK